MAWVAVHQQLRDHRKIRDLYRRLGISRQEAVGILVMLWLWALDNTDQTGELLNTTREDISNSVYYSGNSSVLYSALVDSKWLDEVDGKIFVHDWYDFNKPFYDSLAEKKRKAEYARNKRLQENSNGENSGDSSVDSSGNNSSDGRRDNSRSHSPSHKPSPSPKKDKKDYSPEIENFRHRYSDFLDLIDRYIDILRTTRVSGKISDSIMCQVYAEMDKHPVIVVKYACFTVVNKPDLHSKKENYFYGIMRNTTAEEAESKLEHEKPRKEGMTAWGTQIRK